MGLGDTPEVDIAENNEVDTKELKQNKSGNRWEIVENIFKVVYAVLICFAVLMLIFTALNRATENQKQIEELKTKNNHNEVAIDYLMDEVSRLRVFTDKPIEDYSVKELFTIDMVKEFDATYRQELDDDPDIGEYILLDAKDISEGFLKHRADSKNQPVLIERVFGVVINNKLDGKVIDAGTNDYYISYAGVKGAQKGDLVVSYIMYEKNNYPDDIAVREDFVISG